MTDKTFREILDSFSVTETNYVEVCECGVDREIAKENNGPLVN